MKALTDLYRFLLFGVITEMSIEQKKKKSKIYNKTYRVTLTSFLRYL